ncbi:hypothetical protein HK100_005166, partial [Physocladia obscura]
MSINTHNFRKIFHKDHSTPPNAYTKLHHGFDFGRGDAINGLGIDYKACILADSEPIRLELNRRLTEEKRQTDEFDSDFSLVAKFVKITTPATETMSSKLQATSTTTASSDYIYHFYVVQKVSVTLSNMNPSTEVIKAAKDIISAANKSTSDDTAVYAKYQSFHKTFGKYRIVSAIYGGRRIDKIHKSNASNYLKLENEIGFAESSVEHTYKAKNNSKESFVMSYVFGGDTQKQTRREWYESINDANVEIIEITEYDPIENIFPNHLLQKWAKLKEKFNNENRIVDMKLSLNIRREAFNMWAHDQKMLRVGVFGDVGQGKSSFLRTITWMMNSEHSIGSGSKSGVTAWTTARQNCTIGNFVFVDLPGLDQSTRAYLKKNMSEMIAGRWEDKEKVAYASSFFGWLWMHLFPTADATNGNSLDAAIIVLKAPPPANKVTSETQADYTLRLNKTFMNWAATSKEEVELIQEALGLLKRKVKHAVVVTHKDILKECPTLLENTESFCNKQSWTFVLTETAL